mmetsp:Transcript_3304/g.5484  ORF Transcript_3304/g.5484 Transcript_3304/m.5484 type:complete len:177 (+) Transcript_3304:580-1110(+)
MTNGHEGSKSQRLNWIGSSQQIFTTGTNAYNERSYGLFDMRDLTKPLCMKKLDNNNHIMQTHLDSDTMVVYIVNKGHFTTQFFYLNLEGTKDGLPELIAMDQFKLGNQNQQQLFMLPKQNVNPAKNELMRGLRLASKQAEYVSFKVMRKSELQNDDLYPDFPSETPALTFEEWASG